MTTCSLCTSVYLEKFTVSSVHCSHLISHICTFFPPPRHGQDGLTVHFNVHLNPSSSSSTSESDSAGGGLSRTEQVEAVLRSAIAKANGSNVGNNGGGGGGDNLLLNDEERKALLEAEEAAEESVLGDLVIDEESLDVQGEWKGAGGDTRCFSRETGWFSGCIFFSPRESMQTHTE